ncbi:hypothetical protein HDU91_004199, partial [Kappamyces sp. JEL0680]
VLVLASSLFYSAFRTKPEVHTEILIRAPPSVVWDALVQVEHYHRWNPSRSGTGLITHQGQRPDWRLVNGVPDQATVTRFAPPDALVWQGELLGMSWLMAGSHYFYLSQSGPDETLVQHGEQLRGLLPRLFWPFIRSGLERDFAAVNEALDGYCVQTTAE